MLRVSRRPLDSARALSALGLDREHAIVDRREMIKINEAPKAEVEVDASERRFVDRERTTKVVRWSRLLRAIILILVDLSPN